MALKSFRLVKEHRPFLAVLSVALIYFTLLSVISFRYYDIGQTMAVENDFYGTYAPAARSILQGDFSSPAYYEYRGIGYPLALAILTRLTGDFFLSGKIISLISSFFSLILVYLIFSHLSFPAMVFLIILGLMFTKPFMLYSYTVGTDMFFLALILLSLYLVMVGRTSRYSNYSLLLSGLISGYAFLTRYNQLFFLMPLLGYLWTDKSQTELSSRLKSFFFFLSTYLIILLPWFLLLYQMTGNPFYNLNYRNLAYDFIYMGDVDKDYFWQHLSENYQSAWQVIRAAPGSFLWKFAKNLTHHLPQQFERAFPPYIIGCLAMGTVMFLIRVSKSYFRLKAGLPLDKFDQSFLGKDLLFVFITAGIFYVFSGFIHFEERYFLFLLPVYLFLSFFPFLIIHHKIFDARFGFLKDRFLSGLVTLVLGMTIIAPMAYASYQSNLKWLKTLPRELLFFKDFINFLPAGNKKIMARTAHLPAITGNTFEQLPITSSDVDFYNYLGRKGVDLVYFSSLEAGKRPALAYLLHDHSPRDGLIPLVKWEKSGRKAVLYLSTFGQMRGLPLFPILFLRAPGEGLAVHSGLMVLKGLIRIEIPGNYEIALAGENFNLDIDGIKLLHSERGGTNNFYRNKILLSAGWHTMELNFEMKPNNYFLTGPFWQTPEGKREPIPQASLKVLAFESTSK